MASHTSSIIWEPQEIHFSITFSIVIMPFFPSHMSQTNFFFFNLPGDNGKCNIFLIFFFPQMMKLWNAALLINEVLNFQSQSALALLQIQGWFKSCHVKAVNNLGPCTQPELAVSALDTHVTGEWQQQGKVLSLSALTSAAVLPLPLACSRLRGQGGASPEAPPRDKAGCSLCYSSSHRRCLVSTGSGRCHLG